MARRARRQYRRSDRVSELLREILADELERIDVESFELLTITGVKCDDELTTAFVYFSSLAGPERDEEIGAELERHRQRLQRAIATQARLRRTPALRFRADDGVRSGTRIEEILRSLETDDETADPDDDGPAVAPPG